MDIKDIMEENDCTAEEAGEIMEAAREREQDLSLEAELERQAGIEEESLTN